MNDYYLKKMLKYIEDHQAAQDKAILRIIDIVEDMLPEADLEIKKLRKIKRELLEFSR